MPSPHPPVLLPKRSLAMFPSSSSPPPPRTSDPGVDGLEGACAHCRRPQGDVVVRKCPGVLRNRC